MEKLNDRQFSLDREIFGADRQRLLESLQAGGSAIAAGENGFGLAREGSRATYLGPISAVDTESGLEILRRLTDTVDPGPEGLVFLDLPDDNMAATDLAAESSFEPVRTLTRMFLGENAAPGAPLRRGGIADPGLG